MTLWSGENENNDDLNDAEYSFVINWSQYLKKKKWWMLILCSYSIEFSASAPCKVVCKVRCCFELVSCGFVISSKHLFLVFLLSVQLHQSDLLWKNDFNVYFHIVCVLLCFERTLFTVGVIFVWTCLSWAVWSSQWCIWVPVQARL